MSDITWPTTKEPTATRGLAAAIVSLLGLTAVLGLAAFAVLERRIGIYDRLLDGLPISVFGVSYDDRMIAFTGVTTGLVSVAIAVLVMVWGFRFVRNVRSLDAEPSPSEGWAIGAWFIPIIGALLAAKTLWNADRAADPAPGSSRRWLIVPWIVGFLASYAGYRSTLISNEDRGTMSTISTARSKDVLSQFGAVALILASVFGALAVWFLTRRQEAVIAQHAHEIRSRNARAAAAAADRHSPAERPTASHAAPLPPTDR